MPPNVSQLPPRFGLHSLRCHQTQCLAVACQDKYMLGLALQCFETTPTSARTKTTSLRTGPRHVMAALKLSPGCCGTGSSPPATIKGSSAGSSHPRPLYKQLSGQKAYCVNLFSEPSGFTSLPRVYSAFMRCAISSLAVHAAF